MVTACTAVLLMGCASTTHKKGKPALFSSKAEAEKAAKDFNCSGAHKMGDLWMPCEKHEGFGHHHSH